MPAPGMHSGVATDDAMNLSMSEHAVPLYEAVKAFIANEVDPITEEFYRLGEGRAERWGYGEGQLELLDGVKAKAKANGLWNFFLPERRDRRGPVEPRLRLHRHRARQEPARVGVPQLLGARHRQHGGARAGRHPGAEGAVARAAARRRDPLGLRDDRARRGQRPTPRTSHARAVLDGDEWVINGEKYYISGAGDPRCKIMIVMVQTSPTARRTSASRRSSCRWTRPASRSLGADARVRRGRRPARPHAPRASPTSGCRRRTCCSARAGASRSRQVRLGPGRIHHCMRSIGAAEKALELMVRRGLNREAFGKPLASLGKNTEMIAKARIEIEAMRLMVLRAAKAMDVHGQRRGPGVGQRRQGDGADPRLRRSSTRRSRSTAPPASRSGRRSPGCTPASARCAWPTVPTRCTGTSSAAPRSPATPTTARRPS